MSFSFSFITTSGDRAKALVAAATPPESVAAFLSSAIDAIGTLPDGWLIQVMANGHLDAPGTASATASTPMPPVTQSASLTVQALQVTE